MRFYFHEKFDTYGFKFETYCSKVFSQFVFIKSFEEKLILKTNRLDHFINDLSLTRF
ncbi:hypothetical protein LEP1GSC044_0732 [Leptospira kirschneri serovar Grippotyphosa str. RM52]|nr:hypothetical protein LEP1GSC044_0732 [Leptospira kirschneri serovar Grippotyphosa str. RM52]